MMDGRIEIAVVEGVADVRLVRADKMNALDQLMFDALVVAGDIIRARDDVRAIVLSGDGPAFCAGLDLQSFENMTDTAVRIDLIERTHGIANIAQHVVTQWRDMAVPVIAAVHGFAFGGGFQLMLGADLRFMHPATKLSIMEMKWGLVPDMAGMLLIRDLVRPDIVAELTYSGRVFDGEEASRIGLATRLCDDPRTAALEAAREITSKSPKAVRAAKRILSIGDMALAERVLLAEAVEQANLMGQPEQVEAVRASLQKRRPDFSI